jgi:hypothetical protein
MNIRRYARIRERLERLKDKFISIQDIEERWKQLIGPGCGYFIDWRIECEEVDIVTIIYDRPRGGGTDTEEIPIEFFEIEDEQEAVAKFRSYIEEQRELEEKKEDELRETKERKLFEELKQKYE